MAGTRKEVLQLENVLKTRIQLKYDTLANWNSSTLVLKQGELAIAEVPSSASNSGLTPPAIGIKVGDGTKTFIQLPWIQASAGDVYAWAKAATKPEYSASEISGLQQYIQNNSSNLQYQVVKGTTTTDANKYYLQSKEGDSGTWTTVSTIDLSDTDTRIKTLEDWANTEYSLSQQIQSSVNYKISSLDYTDTAVDHQFVTSVSETDGVINVERAAITAGDITGGTLPVNRGGTGASSLNAGEVLIGNGTEAVTTKAIDGTVSSGSSNLITSGAVKSYVDTVTASITGAMHFIGSTTTTIFDGSASNPQIEGYNFANAQKGDVILSGSAEFVWTGTAWELLGDEGSYAVKGSIRNADIAANADIAQSKIAGLEDDLDSKVDKVEDKGLSTNDFTNELKTKLDSVEANAEENVIEQITVGGTAITPDSNKSVALGKLAGKDSVAYADLANDVKEAISGATAALDDIAYDGEVSHLKQTDGTILVFDCGNGSDKKYD